MSEKASTSSSAPSGKQKERDNTVKFSLALNSTQYIPAAEPPSPSSPTNFVSESVHSGRGSISSPHPRRHTQKHLRSIVSNIEDDNSINDNVRQLVSNDRVLYEASALSSSITEYKALKIAFNSLSSTIRLNLGSIGDGTVSKDLVNLHPGLDKYDMRALYFMLSLSCVIFLTLTIFWHSQVCLLDITTLSQNFDFNVSFPRYPQSVLSSLRAFRSSSIALSCFQMLLLKVSHVAMNIVIFKSMIKLIKIGTESVIIIQNLGFKVKKKYFFGQEAVKVSFAVSPLK
jgi:hypothetical protein